MLVLGNKSKAWLWNLRWSLRWDLNYDWTHGLNIFRKGDQNPESLHIFLYPPSQPRSTCPVVLSASDSRSGNRPFKSKDARQPWKPSLECTSFGRSLYISLDTPPTNRSPREWRTGVSGSTRKPGNIWISFTLFKCQIVPSSGRL